MKAIVPFQNNERVVCLGDSTTQGGAWPYYLAEYVLTHTGKRVDFINAGISGGNAAGALIRLDYDVIDRRPTRVFLQLGLNDVGRDLYYTDTPDAALTAARQEILDTYRKRIQQIIERLTAEKIEVILLTTFPFDQYNPDIAAAGEITCCNSMGLVKLNNILHQLAEEYDLPLIDIFTPMTEVYRKHPEARVTDDRVHPKRFGYLLAAAWIVEAIYGKQSLGEIILSPEKTQCCTALADGIEFSSTRVRFICHPGLLPFRRDEDYKLASRVFDLDTLLNNEIWRITGLTETRYRLWAGGINCGLFYATELAAGINSTRLQTPAAAQAVNIAVLVETLRQVDQIRRSIVQTELIAREHGGDPADEAGMRKALNLFLDRVEDKPYCAYFRNIFNDYWEQLRANRSVFELRHNEILHAFWDAFVPAPYMVELIAHG